MLSCKFKLLVLGMLGEYYLDNLVKRLIIQVLSI